MSWDEEMAGGIIHSQFVVERGGGPRAGYCVQTMILHLTSGGRGGQRGERSRKGPWRVIVRVILIKQNEFQRYSVRGHTYSVSA